MDDSPLNFDRGADLPVFVPIESFPNLSDAEIEAITRSGDPRLRNAEDVCKAGDLAHASASIEEILHGVMSPKDMGNCPMYATKSENEDLVRMLVTSGVHSYVGIAKMAIELRSAAILALLLGHGWEINQDGAWCVPLVLS